MKKWLIELILVLVIIFLLTLSVKCFGFQNTVICTLSVLISRNMITGLWNKIK
jgi:hypothetical protein